MTPRAIIGRLLGVIPTLLITWTFVFGAMRLVPGDPVLEFHIVSVQELSAPATLGTDLAFPPGYLRAFRYNLACELAPEFGVEPSRQVQRIAMTSKRNLKRINNPDDIMALPYSIVATRQRFNIFAGNY